MPMKSRMEEPRFNDRRRALATASGVVLIAVLLVSVSALFAQSDQTGRVIATARRAQRAEEVLTATTASRSSLAVSLVLASGGIRLPSGEDPLSLAIDDLGEVLRELDGRIARLEAEDWPVSDTRFAQYAAEVGAALEGGRVEEAQTLIEGEVLPALDAVEADASRARDSGLSLLAAEQGSAGSMARASSVAVGLIVPGLALFSYQAIQRRQQRQRELEIKLEHQEERSRIKDEMIANLSHELRTPLTGIYGMALTLSEEGFSDPSFCSEVTDIIVSEAADLSRMVDDLLAAAKVEAGDIAILPTDVDPVSLVDEVLVPFLRSRHIPSRLEPSEVVADALRLKQVLRNLVSNAIKHGGSQVAVAGRSMGSNYRISVVDDGPGVADDLRERLFDRFIHEGAAPLTAGSIGLGLSIAHELVVRMNGSLTYSREGGNTTFSVDLPLAVAAAPLPSSVRVG